MTRRRLYNTLLVLLTLVAAIVLAKLLWSILSVFTDLLLLLGLAWLIAFILRPVATWLAEGPLARRLIAWVWRRRGEQRAAQVRRLLDPIAVTLVYLGLLALLVISLIAIVPVILNQSRQLIMTIADHAGDIPALIDSFQADVAAWFNLPPEVLRQFYRPDELSRQLTVVIEAAPRSVAFVLRRVASGIGEGLLVLALSYYLMLDGRRVARQIRDVLPKRYHDEYELAATTVVRTFGGFLRGQVVMAVLSGVVTAVAAGVAGIRYGAMIGVIAGLVMFIPLIGAPIAMFLPSVIGLVQGVPLIANLLLLAFLTIFQQVLLHFVVPRIMSESIGMPSLLILVSVLIGVRLWGVWGFIFGIPVAGAVYSIGIVMLRRLKREQDRLDDVRRHEARPHPHL